MEQDTLKKKISILFVDDEPGVLAILKAAMMRQAQDWQAEFVSSGAAALELLARKPIDIVISDMRMPGMTGAELLNEVMKKYPSTIRMILSGFSDEASVMRCVGATHQFLSKPLDLNVLRNLLKRMMRLDQQVNSPDMKALARKIKALPSMPETYLKIVEALKSPQTTVSEISAIVSLDFALTANLLKLVNSAFFGVSRNVTSASDAVQMLGVNRIRALALTLNLFSALETKQCKAFCMESVSQRSLMVGLLAQRVMEMESGSAADCEEAFTGGLLSNIGKMLLAHNMPQHYETVCKEVKSSGKTLLEMEEQEFNTNHANVGAYLLGLWGLPLSLVESVAFHHHPGLAAETRFSPLSAVHIADALISETSKDPVGLFANRLDEEYLKKLDLIDRLPIYRNLRGA